MTRLPASIARSIAACEDRALLIAIEMHKDYSAVRLKTYDVIEVKIEGTVMHRSLILVGVLTFALVAEAQTKEEETQQELRSGEKISTALATITTTAISPLVGVCGMGAWRYC